MDLMAMPSHYYELYGIIMLGVVGSVVAVIQLFCDDRPCTGYGLLVKGVFVVMSGFAVSSYFEIFNYE